MRSLVTVWPFSLLGHIIRSPDDARNLCTVDVEETEIVLTRYWNAAVSVSMVVVVVEAAAVVVVVVHLVSKGPVYMLGICPVYLVSRALSSLSVETMFGLYGETCPVYLVSQDSIFLICLSYIIIQIWH